MTGRPRWLATVSVLVVLAVVLAGCDRVTGGGWIHSVKGSSGKATFGFSARCRNDQDPELGPVAALYDGQIEWDDRLAGVRFHGDIEPDVFVIQPGTCNDAHALVESFGIATFTGRYRPQLVGAPTDEGSFLVSVRDDGEPGLGGDEISGDYILIGLTGGRYNGYVNQGPVQGGNIQVN